VARAPIPAVEVADRAHRAIPTRDRRPQAPTAREAGLSLQRAGAPERPSPTIPQAANLATGAGVKVAVFPDGLDPNNPDLIRANGQRVITDYRDFTGEGPNAPSGAAEAFGDASSDWALCTPKPEIYQECTDFKAPPGQGAPASLEQFGGVSQSTPLTRAPRR
jgi:hypothetical protein